MDKINAQSCLRQCNSYGGDVIGGKGSWPAWLNVEAGVCLEGTFDLTKKRNTTIIHKVLQKAKHLFCDLKEDLLFKYYSYNSSLVVRESAESSGYFCKDVLLR